MTLLSPKCDPIPKRHNDAFGEPRGPLARFLPISLLHDDEASARNEQETSESRSPGRKRQDHQDSYNMEERKNKPTLLWNVCATVKNLLLRDVTIVVRDRYSGIVFLFRLKSRKSLLARALPSSFGSKLSHEVCLASVSSNDSYANHGHDNLFQN